MAKQRRNTGSLWKRLIGTSSLLLSILSFLGTFGISKPGRTLFFFFARVLGHFAWVGPYILLALAFYLWVNSWDSPRMTRQESAAGSELKTRKSEHSRSRQTSTPERESSRALRQGRGSQHQKKESRHTRRNDGLQARDPLNQGGLALPPTKLVNLKGFNQYFRNEWTEVGPPPQEGIQELGQNFPTYFGEGKAVPKPSVSIESLHGLRAYFREVDEGSLLSPAQDIPDQSSGPGIPSIPGISDFRGPGGRPDARDRQDSPSYRSHATTEHAEPFRSSTEHIPSDPAPRTSDLDAAPFQALPQLSIPVGKAENEASAYPGQFAHLFDTQRERVETEKPPVIAQQLWRLPGLDLLEPAPNLTVTQENETPKRLEGVLQDFGVKAKVVRVARGPVITRYELAPAAGVKISRIVNLADDIALALAARDVRIEAPIPGKAAIGIEIPNKQARAVSFREVADTGVYRENTSLLKVAFGKDIANQAVVGDLAKMPHLLVAGATGAGKSVCITTIIQSILFNATPAEVKFLLIDPKMVELSHYNGVPHLLAPVVTDPKKAATALKWIVKEMENRYELFAAAGVREIARYNQDKLNSDPGKAGALPWIMVIIDELADLMLVASGDVEEAIGRLAQMARAAGIHLVIATQRPSVDVITGVIKANIPSRISFAVSSQIDSRTILDSVGAEKLIGKGDMLYSPLGLSKPIRVQGCLVTDEEVERVIAHWKALGKPEYLDPDHLFAEVSIKAEETNGMEDELFLDAGRLILKSGMASVTFLQRRLKLGYARAARLMDMLEEQGIVGPYEGSKPRQVLISLAEFEERFG